jgi:hypothetical protein
MADERASWFGAMVSFNVKGVLPVTADKDAALLLDRRLAWTKGARIMSFIAGIVATFLQKDFLPNSEVLRGLPGETLEQLDNLLKTAMPDFDARAAAATLLFRSTRDGANAAAFHAHCDGKGPTLVLIKDSDGNVFGGYTQKNWSSPIYSYAGKGVSDPAAFLISVVSPHGTPPVMFPSTGSWASICCDSLCGPWFGAGIGVSGAFNDKCWSGVEGFQYVNPTNRPAKEVMTGSRYFKPVIVEVYGL